MSTEVGTGSNRCRRLLAGTLVPYRQGAFDGLCRVYSVINALRVLCPDIDEDTHQRLFRDLLTAATDDRAAVKVVCDGLGIRRFRRLIERAVTFAAKRGFDIGTERLPADLCRRPTLDRLWQALSEAITAEKVALLGLDGCEHHWTVAIGISAKHLRLFDSDGKALLRRRRCSVEPHPKRVWLVPSNIVLLERRA